MQDTGEGRGDRRIVEELEFLYREVARRDQPEEAKEAIGGPPAGQRVPDIPPGNAISDVHPALEKARRFPGQPPPRREALMERLNKVSGAYEKMLTCWPYASGDLPPSGT